VGQDVDDLEDVLLGNVQPIGHVRDLYKPVLGQGAINQDADCVAGLLRQAHIWVTCDRAAAALISDKPFLSQF
jgi:hypothetical protein